MLVADSIELPTKTDLYEADEHAWIVEQQREVRRLLATIPTLRARADEVLRDAPCLSCLERAESLAREHARLALANLEIVVDHRDVLTRLPGAALITLPDRPKPAPEPA